MERILHHWRSSLIYSVWGKSWSPKDSWLGLRHLHFDGVCFLLCTHQSHSYDFSAQVHLHLCVVTPFCDFVPQEFPLASCLPWAQLATGWMRSTDIELPVFSPSQSPCEHCRLVWHFTSDWRCWSHVSLHHCRYFLRTRVYILLQTRAFHTVDFSAYLVCGKGGDTLHGLLCPLLLNNCGHCQFSLCLLPGSASYISLLDLCLRISSTTVTEHHRLGNL
jgi:hypothetical protein